jgi:hypothetical protein
MSRCVAPRAVVVVGTGGFAAVARVQSRAPTYEAPFTLSFLVIQYTRTLEVSAFSPATRRLQLHASKRRSAPTVASVPNPPFTRSMARTMASSSHLSSATLARLLEVKRKGSVRAARREAKAKEEASLATPSTASDLGAAPACFAVSRDGSLSLALCARVPLLRERLDDVQRRQAHQPTHPSGSDGSVKSSSDGTGTEARWRRAWRISLWWH